MDEKILGFIALKILNGLAYLERKKILHRDLKPQNILINKKGEIKISDFGESGQLKQTYSYKNTLVGTLIYNSPERVTGKKYYSNCDIWSLGILLLEATLGHNPLIKLNEDLKNLTFILFEERVKESKLPVVPKTYSD